MSRNIAHKDPLIPNNPQHSPKPHSRTPNIVAWRYIAPPPYWSCPQRRRGTLGKRSTHVCHVVHKSKPLVGIKVGIKVGISHSHSQGGYQGRYLGKDHGKDQGRWHG